MILGETQKSVSARLVEFENRLVALFVTDLIDLFLPTLAGVEAVCCVKHEAGLRANGLVGVNYARRHQNVSAPLLRRLPLSARCLL